MWRKEDHGSWSLDQWCQLVKDLNWMDLIVNHNDWVVTCLIHLSQLLHQFISFIVGKHALDVGDVGIAKSLLLIGMVVILQNYFCLKLNLLASTTKLNMKDLFDVFLDESACEQTSCPVNKEHSALEIHICQMKYQAKCIWSDTLDLVWGSLTVGLA